MMISNRSGMVIRWTGSNWVVTVQGFNVVADYVVCTGSGDVVYVETPVSVANLALPPFVKVRPEPKGKHGEGGVLLNGV